jgi:L-asparaginase
LPAKTGNIIAMHILPRPRGGSERTRMLEKLLIITTGGTIDKIYFDDKSDYQIGEPQIGKTLNLMDVGFSFDICPLMRKDSLHLDADDRALIRAEVVRSETPHILITHGTDTMVETAIALMDIPGKTIVLTGALHPARFRDSDAVFNIGCAVGAVQSLPEGVWIVMSGRVWAPGSVRKNVAENRFEPSGS